MTTNRPLRVFLCHSSNDKPAVRELYQKLRAEAWIEPWLDEEELTPGDKWEIEIKKTVESTDVVLVCLSNNSINKRGFVQKELRLALDVALEMPEETVFIIPLRLEECTPPRSLRDWQYADYFEGQRERGLERLLISLKRRVTSLNLNSSKTPEEKIAKQNEEDNLLYMNNLRKSIQEQEALFKTLFNTRKDKLTLSNGMEFMRVPAGEFIMGNDDGDIDEKPEHKVNINYDYWMGRFPVTNKQYNTYVDAVNAKHPVDFWWEILYQPVINVKWIDALAYVTWLLNIIKNELPSSLTLRLPTEPEWEKAARGTDRRIYPWGNVFDENKCNTNKDGEPMSVGYYAPNDESPYGCSDMVSNVWEWTCSLKLLYPYVASDGREDPKAEGYSVLRGGTGNPIDDSITGCTVREIFRPFRRNMGGIRLCIAPPLPK